MVSVGLTLLAMGNAVVETNLDFCLRLLNNCSSGLTSTGSALGVTRMGKAVVGEANCCRSSCCRSLLSAGTNSSNRLGCCCGCLGVVLLTRAKSGGEEREKGEGEGENSKGLGLGVGEVLNELLSLGSGVRGLDLGVVEDPSAANRDANGTLTTSGDGLLGDSGTTGSAYIVQWKLLVIIIFMCQRV